MEYIVAILILGCIDMKLLRSVSSPDKRMRAERYW